MQIVAHVGALLPLALLIADLAGGRLGFNPIRTITLRTGRYTLSLLMLTLACTPVHILFGYRAAIRVRKPLGLYAALYATLHFCTFAAWDYGLQFDLIWVEVRDRPFIRVGLLALLILISLAVTSTRGWMRRLGKVWKWLHRLIYAAGLLAVIHFLWVVKAAPREPVIYGVLLAALLAVRLPFVRRAARRVRARIAGKQVRRTHGCPSSQPQV